MSFIKRNRTTGKEYAPGYFLAHEECTRKTYQFKEDDTNAVTADNGGKYIPMGTVIMDGENVAGIAYEDVDVTYGDMPGSLVTAGTVYKDRLNGAADEAKLKEAGFTVIANAPTVERPAGFEVEDADDSTTDSGSTEGGN